jgi:hypothetical protein
MTTNQLRIVRSKSDRGHRHARIISVMGRPRDQTSDLVRSQAVLGSGVVRTEFQAVRPAQLGFAGRDPHPHRQLQLPLRGNSGIHRRLRGTECRAHPVAGVPEQPTAVRLHRLTQYLVVCGQRRPHPIGAGLPPTGRALDIGEQQRHHPRRSSGRRSGHPCRISQQTRSELAHRRNPAQTPPRGTARYPLAGSQRRYGTCWLASGDTIVTWNDSGLAA